ncbi:MAG: hypothetical protein ACOX5Z_01375 [Desulfobulbus sp.]
MAVLPMMEKYRPVQCHADWPLWYMNDFSRLGLRVGSLERAIAVLREGGYPVSMDESGAAVRITGYDQIPAIRTLLASHRVDCEPADLITCAYQG